jgi:hypothetical protein
VKSVDLNTEQRNLAIKEKKKISCVLTAFYHLLIRETLNEGNPSLALFSREQCNLGGGDP